MSNYDYDFLVIGGGNGGLAAAKRAAGYGARVGLVEANRFGGTGNNFGTIPKKIMYHIATMCRVAKVDGPKSGIQTGDVKVDWETIVKKRDDYSAHLHEVETKQLKDAQVTIIEGYASFQDEHKVEIVDKTGSKTTVSADKILLSLGSKSVLPEENGISEHCISSDGYFQMKNLPGKVVIGGDSEGYIGIEMSYVLQALGCETHWALRGPVSMRYCDHEVNKILDEEMERFGVKIYRSANGFSSVGANGGKKTVTLGSGQVIEGVDTVIYTPIRKPNVDGANLEKAGVKMTGGEGYIAVDDMQCTSTSNIFAVGDVTTDKHQLTPKTEAAARRLVDRLFGGVDNAKVTFENAPYAFFSYPKIANVGVTELEAIETFGEGNVKVYRSFPPSLYHKLKDECDQPRSFIKIICAGRDEKVVGLHLLGMGVEESMQGFALAIKMGATKADFDSCIAIEPTFGGEIVKMCN